MLPLLPLIVLVPLAAIVPLLVFDRRRAHDVALGASIATFALVALMAYLAYANGLDSLSFNSAYIKELGIGFEFGLTSAGLMLAVMTSVVFLAASVVGRYFIRERERIYSIIFLLAEGSSLGVFLSGNLFLFYLFWEIGEVMMFFIIFLYGGFNRRYASLKFILYSIVSSLMLLIAIILIYTGSSVHTFSISELRTFANSIPNEVQLAIIALMLGSFLIKMPVFPLHTWLPDAHTEAPTTGSMILAGVLLKFGGYGLFLMFLLLPLARHYALHMALLFILSSTYAAILTLRQTNIKRMIAYTSITDMGIVGMGIASGSQIGVSGALFLMLAHGIAVSLLFLIAGTLDELYGTMEISKIGGVVRNFPWLAYLFVAGAFMLLGLPLTAGFVGDVLVFIGSFSTFKFVSLLPLLGLAVVGAALFWVAETTFFRSSRVTEPYNAIDREVMAGAVLLIAASVVLGVLPFVLLG
ncbi:MAG: NADH-quinone oxidoreductase subunit M [Candidatus Micrarchaeota archaeon]|nr:NADH-quinone oxidoreductase subunit M [Candidatus Micrarchaeota archaeon]